MTEVRVALLDASETDEMTRKNFVRDIDADVDIYDSRSGGYPMFDAYDAAVVTGSRASVYWDEPWIDELKTRVREAINTGLPVLGVCFGHQLVADVRGGSVVDRGNYEIGYHEIQRCDVPTRNAPGPDLLEGLPETFTAFTTHSDEVVDLPDSAVALAENEYSLQAFRDGPYVFGVQFHPEYDMETAATVVRGKPFIDERKQQILDGITEAEYEKAFAAKRVFDNFVAIARATAHNDSSDKQVMEDTRPEQQT